MNLPVPPCTTRGGVQNNVCAPSDTKPGGAPDMPIDYAVCCGPQIADYEESGPGVEDKKLCQLVQMVHRVWGNLVPGSPGGHPGFL